MNFCGFFSKEISYKKTLCEVISLGIKLDESKKNIWLMYFKIEVFSIYSSRKKQEG